MWVEGRSLEQKCEPDSSEPQEPGPARTGRQGKEIPAMLQESLVQVESRKLEILKTTQWCLLS